MRGLYQGYPASLANNSVAMSLGFASYEASALHAVPWSAVPCSAVPCRWALPAMTQVLYMLRHGPLCHALLCAVPGGSIRLARSRTYCCKQACHMHTRSSSCSELRHAGAADPPPSYRRFAQLMPAGGVPRPAAARKGLWAALLPC